MICSSRLFRGRGKPDLGQGQPDSGLMVAANGDDECELKLKPKSELAKSERSANSNGGKNAAFVRKNAGGEISALRSMPVSDFEISCFGCSDTRARLRRLLWSADSLVRESRPAREQLADKAVRAPLVAAPPLYALAKKNLIERKVVAQAIKDLGLDPEMIQPQII